MYIVGLFFNPHFYFVNHLVNHLREIKSMGFCISHIYREGNHCADKLASLGLASTGFTWWNIAPTIIRNNLASNMLGLPCFRVC
jgi:hypothetical protein